MVDATGITASRIAENGLAANDGVKIAYLEAYKSAGDNDIVVGFAKKVHFAVLHKLGSSTADTIASISGNTITTAAGHIGKVQGYVIYT